MVATFKVKTTHLARKTLIKLDDNFIRMEFMIEGYIFKVKVKIRRSSWGIFFFCYWASLAFS